MDDPLADFPVAVEFPIHWGEQDALGHVNNAVYFRWFESSRIAYTRKAGVWDLLDSGRIGPILASTRCDFRRPLVYPDSVRVGTRVVRIGRTSLGLEHRAVGLGSNLVAAEGSSVMVLYNYERSEPTPIPDPIRAAIGAMEGGRDLS